MRIFLGLLVGTAIGTAFGAWVAWQQATTHLGKPIILTKACPQPIEPPTISKRECVNACFSKARMEQVVAAK